MSSLPSHPRRKSNELWANVTSKSTKQHKTTKYSKTINEWKHNKRKKRYGIKCVLESCRHRTSNAWWWHGTSPAARPTDPPAASDLRISSRQSLEISVVKVISDENLSNSSSSNFSAITAKSLPWSYRFTMPVVAATQGLHPSEALALWLCIYRPFKGNDALLKLICLSLWFISVS